MKKIFYLIVISVVIFCCNSNNIAHTGSVGGEVIFHNETGSDLYIKIVPISCLFNGFQDYSLICRYPANGTIRYDYNSTVYLESTQKFTYFRVPSGDEVNIQFDYENEANDASMGYGKCKVIFSLDKWFLSNIIDTFTIEYDAGYGQSLGADVTFYYYGGTGNTEFNWTGSELHFIDDEDVNRKIECWNQYEAGSRQKNLGSFSYGTNNPYTIFPQNTKRDCDLEGIPDQLHEFEDNRSGVLTLNLTIEKDITTPSLSQIIDFPTKFIVNPQVYLKINNGKSIDFTEVQSTLFNSHFEMTVESDGRLILNPNSQIIVRNKNYLKLKYLSRLYLGSGSLIDIKPGGTLCNFGALIRGNVGTIKFDKGGNHTLACVADPADFVVKDSVSIILDSAAVLEIADSTNLYISGKKSSLIMHPNSKIKFGVKSKLVLDSNAKLIANNATFTSTDSNKTWDGIYCTDTYNDTIKNCKIINAKGGINFLNKLSSNRSIIKDCEFINKTTSNLDNGVYAYNSDKILIRGNHFYAKSSGVFENGVYLEYCTSNELNILDNNIEDVVNGIVDIGSWSYIARNTVTGAEGSGIGITLDDYSGNLKNNIVSNFEYSLYALISSPYLYKNSFHDASIANLELESYSVPLLRPIQSGDLKYWVGGDNVISVSDEAVGINLLEESYPLIKDGYNKFYLNSADYFISGEIPEELHDSLEARNNNWNATVSQSKFDITDATVKYSPTEDGSEANRYFNTIIPMSIGFGQYDSIKIDDQSDNPVITELFLLANNEIIQGNYSDAIDHFKEIVSSKDSTFANLSLKKVYYCYSMTNFFNSNYTEAKNYFSNINNDTTYSDISRTIAKNLYLKTKIRNSEYESVEEEYDNIYQNNMNNSLGLHALINKTILENLVSDTTDNFSGNTGFADLSTHKRNIFNIINSNTNSRNGIISQNSILVKDYNLSQNFPNPFNPTTTINYQLSKDGMVKINIYDITGKEVMTVLNEFKQAGSYTVQFNGSNLSSGIYFYKLTEGNFEMTKRMVLVK